MYVTFHACMYILYIDNFFHKKQLASLVQCSLGERLQKNRKKERNAKFLVLVIMRLQKVCKVYFHLPR